MSIIFFMTSLAGAGYQAVKYVMNHAEPVSYTHLWQAFSKQSWTLIRLSLVLYLVFCGKSWLCSECTGHLFLLQSQTWQQTVVQVFFQQHFCHCLLYTSCGLCWAISSSSRRSLRGKPKSSLPTPPIPSGHETITIKHSRTLFGVIGKIRHQPIGTRCSFRWRQLGKPINWFSWSWLGSLAWRYGLSLIHI